MENSITLKNCVLPENKILVLPIKKSIPTSGIISSNTSEKPNSGTVILVGSDKVLLNSVVYYSLYAGTEIEIEKEKYLILNTEDIIASFKQN